MNNRLFSGIIVMSAMALLLMATPGYAQRGPFYETSYPAHVTKKVVRGFQNIIFSPVEVPKEIIMEWQRSDPGTGVWLGGGRGLYMMGRRISFGVYDLVTFGFRLPWDERIEPEVVLLDRID